MTTTSSSAEDKRDTVYGGDTGYYTSAVDPDNY